MSTHAGTGANRLGLRATESQTAKMAVQTGVERLLRHSLIKEIICLFSGIVKGLGLCLPIIYNRIKEIDMTFFVLLVGACLIGLVGAEVMNAQ